MNFRVMEACRSIVSYTCPMCLSNETRPCQDDQEMNGRSSNDPVLTKLCNDLTHPRSLTRSSARVRYRSKGLYQFKRWILSSSSITLLHDRSRITGRTRYNGIAIINVSLFVELETDLPFCHSNGVFRFVEFLEKLQSCQRIEIFHRKFNQSIKQIFHIFVTNLNKKVNE